MTVGRGIRKGPEQNERDLQGEDMNWRDDLSSELEGVVTVQLMKAAARLRDRYTKI